MPVILQCSRVPEKACAYDEPELLNDLKQYLVANNLTDYCGIDTLPKGEGPDGDGIVLYPQDGLWVLADVCRGKRLNPCLFTSIADAVGFLKYQLEK